MSIDLRTVKRGNNLLSNNDNETSLNTKKKAGRKKLENPELKLNEKVVTYITKKEKDKLDELVKSRGLNIAQYVRMLILSNK